MITIACLYPNAFGTGLGGLPRCRDVGYEAVQLHPRAFLQQDAGGGDGSLPADAPLDALFEAVSRAGLLIAAWGGYRPLIGEAQTVEGHVAYLSQVLRLAGRAAREAPELAQPIVCTETGAPGSPKTQTQVSGEPGGSGTSASPFGSEPKPVEPWRQLVGSLRRLAMVAEEAGAKVAIEPTRMHIICDAKTAQAVIEEVGSAAVGVCYDPANIIRRGEALRESFDPLASHIFISHAKDVRFAEDGSVTEYPAAGKGMLDYEEFFRLLSRFPADHTLAVEYARSEEELQRVAAFLRRLRGSGA